MSNINSIQSKVSGKIFKEMKISISSPIGKGLLGLSVGDVAEINVPAGLLKLEVIEISR